MRKSIFLFAVLILAVFTFILKTNAEEISKEKCFFFSSLHHTTRGMAYWYDRDNGGLEAITNIPYDSPKLDCLNCHVETCDVCHKAEVEGKLTYSTEHARNQEICLKCHKREKSIMKIDKDEDQQDVHVAKNMQCMDCHTAREVHGDGNEYNSMKQSGALDAKCEKCHASVEPTTSHKVHGDKLDCNACHVRHVVSCSNCHIKTLVEEGKRVNFKLYGWVFLMNYNGRVTSATTQTFVAPGNKTFLMFAPQNSHSIMKDGRKCGDCHATDIVKKAQGGSIDLTWDENGKVQHLKGVIPVIEGVQYKNVYYDYQNGEWILIENPQDPILRYAGYGKPLSENQLRKLALPMSR